MDNAMKASDIFVRYPAIWSGMVMGGLPKSTFLQHR